MTNTFGISHCCQGGVPPRHTTALADRLLTACHRGDLPSAKAAVADGASVNEHGNMVGEIVGRTYLPLWGSVMNQHLDVTIWLLARGADPNGDSVMWAGAGYSTPEILQLLIDSGGDVNLRTCGWVPLFFTVRNNNLTNLEVRHHNGFAHEHA